MRTRSVSHQINQVIMNVDRYFHDLINLRLIDYVIDEVGNRVWEQIGDHVAEIATDEIYDPDEFL